MTGLERTRAVLEGKAPPPPIQELIGFSMVEASTGSTVFALEIRPEHYNPMGTLHGGVLCDMADAAMGYATLTTLEAEQSFTTLELKANYFKPVWNGRLVATAKVVKRTRKIAYVECEVSDEGGSLVAKMSSTCMVLRGEAASGR